MTVISPRHGTREAPEAAGLEAEIRHEGGWPALSISASPQIVEIVLTNRTPYRVHSDMARVSALFRPGILTDVEAIALAPQSEADWALTLTRIGSADHDLRLTFDSAHRGAFAPGESRIIRLAGVSASAKGGSRATRVELSFERFFHDEGPEITGGHLLHLPVLRRHGADPLPMREIHSGSAVRSGPLMAGFVGGRSALNDGKSPNPLKLRLMNVSGRPLRLNSHGDEATRLHLGWQTGAPDGEWGLMASQGDHLTLSLSSDEETAQAARSWQLDGHTLRCVAPRPLPGGAYLDLDIVLHSHAETGQAQLCLTYENLPDFDDGDLVMLVDLGPISATGDTLDVAKPMHFFGEAGRLAFHAAESFAETGTQSGRAAPDAEIAVDRHSDTAGRLQLIAPKGLEVTGRLAQPAHLSRSPQQFHVGGQLNRYYPVLFEDLDWYNGALHLEIFRSRTHMDAEWRGSLAARVECHSSSWGHGSDYWDLKVRQSGADTVSGYRVFVGGFANHLRAPAHVIWLAGKTTYSWLSNHETRLYNASDLAQPGDIVFPEARNARQDTFKVKTKPDDGFNASFVAIEQSGQHDTRAVPKGAIMMWSGKENAIPQGWVLCDDKTKGVPNLVDRFVMGAVRDKSNIGGPADTHSHSLPGFTAGTTWEGTHSHFVSAAAMPATVGLPVSGQKFQAVTKTASSEDGHHRHLVKISDKQTKTASANRPKWFALCFIMKL